MYSVHRGKIGVDGHLSRIRRRTAVFIAALFACLAVYTPAVQASEESIDQPVLASDSAVFVSQTAALSTSTIRGILGEVSAEVRGPASSYTLTIDSSGGEDITPLLSGTRYNLIECYDLSLTAVNAQSITRNPQFGDVTITIPIASSMDPGKGTFALYTIGTDGDLEQLPCDIVYGRSSGYAVRFMTIHFSTYAILYTSGGSTRVKGSRSRSSSSTGVTIISNEGRSATTTNNNETNSGTASSQPSGTGTAAGTGLSSQTSTTGNAAADNTGISATANGKDNNGKGPDGKDPYDNPKTGDRRYYGTISLAILGLGMLFLIILRIGKRSA